MAVTTFDPKTALLVIDQQKGIAVGPLLHPIVEIAKRARALADAFRDRGLPVVLVNIVIEAPGQTEQARNGQEFPAGWPNLILELNRQPQDCLVTKPTPGAFTNTDLETYLKNLGVTQIVIVGVTTSNGVEATALQAYELGLNITLAVDAMTDICLDAHDYSLTQIFPRLGETGTTQEIIDLLERTA
jgi:nicotinamidase-related amidase